VEYILLLGAIQGTLLSIILFTKKENHTANFILAVAMLALSADVFNAAYIMFGYYRDFPHFMGITYAFPFLYGPIFYLYAKLISTDNKTFNAKYFLHFVPFLLVVIYGIVFVYLKSSEFKLMLVDSKTENLLPGIKMIGYLKPVHGMIYVFLTIKVVSNYNISIRNSYSNIERINLNWLRHLVIGLSSVWGVVVLSFIINAFSAKEIQMDFLIYLAASILIYSIGYFSLHQPQVFSQPVPAYAAVISPAQPEDAEEASYQKSGLTEKEVRNHLDILLHIMETDKPYLNSELNLRDLAEKLSISTHNLSEVLNTGLNQNFYDFVNHYRVEEVKRRLADKESQKYNLLALAFDSGFNSKSSFNTVFKKHTGTTPSLYRKQIV